MERFPFLLLPTLSVLLCAQEPVILQAPIIRVRLHPDEAWVTRSGRTRVDGAGIHRLDIGNLPSGLRLEDLQVSAKGPAGTRMGDVAVRADVRTVTETAEWRKLEGERERLRDRRDDLESQRDSLAAEQKFLRELQATHAKELSTRLAYTLPPSQGLTEFGKSLQQRLAVLMKEERRATRDLNDLTKEERRLDAELLKRQGEQRTAPSIVRVELTTAGAGVVEVELLYRQTQARWRPNYEARLSEDRKTLGLGLYAAITQKTGEPWNGVRLEISNARPSRGLDFGMFDGPQIVSLDYSSPGSTPIKFAHSERALAAQSNTYSAAAPPPPPPRQATAVVEVVASSSEAEMVEEATGLASTWVLEGSKDIPSDGEPHRFRVTGQDLRPTMTLLAVP
ncbi:MAG TPA: mucoidy inhibitor MuiA family protein, partial [Geothrix sp.]|nr:mucoidy inhibitor MuiA family protein [Geothrix sp.]